MKQSPRNTALGPLANQTYLLASETKRSLQVYVHAQLRDCDQTTIILWRGVRERPKSVLCLARFFCLGIGIGYHSIKQ